MGHKPPSIVTSLTGLIAFVAILAPSNVFGAASPAFVQSAIWDGSSTITFTSPTGPGDTYVLMTSVDYMNGGRFTGFPTDTEGNRWTQILDTVSPNGKLEQVVWQALSVKGGSHDAITVHTNGCCSTNMMVVELTNAPYLDQSAQRGTTSIAANGAASAAITTTFEDEIVLAFGSTSPANGSGFKGTQSGYTSIAVGTQYGAHEAVTSVQKGISAQGTVVSGSDNDAVMAIVTYADPSTYIAAAITSAPNASFITGTARSFMVTAEGYPQPVLTEAGALPPGITFNSFTGVLSGTPNTRIGGVYPITLTATNAAGSARQSFTIVVNVVPAFVQGAYEDGRAAVFASLTAPGDTYVLMASVDRMNGGRFTGLPTDTEGNHCWSKILDTVTPDGKLEQAVYQCMGVIGGTRDAVLPATNLCCSQDGMLVELHNATLLDQAAQQYNLNSGPTYTPAITTMQEDEVMLVFGSVSPANGTGFANVLQSGYSEIGIGSQYGAHKAVNLIQKKVMGTASVQTGPNNDSVLAILSYASGTCAFNNSTPGNVDRNPLNSLLWSRDDALMRGSIARDPASGGWFGASCSPPENPGRSTGAGSVGPEPGGPFGRELELPRFVGR